MRQQQYLFVLGKRSWLTRFPLSPLLNELHNGDKQPAVAQLTPDHPHLHLTTQETSDINFWVSRNKLIIIADGRGQQPLSILISRIISYTWGPTSAWWSISPGIRRESVFYSFIPSCYPSRRYNIPTVFIALLGETNQISPSNKNSIHHSILWRRARAGVPFLSPGLLQPDVWFADVLTMKTWRLIREPPVPRVTLDTGSGEFQV